MIAAILLLTHPTVRALAGAACRAVTLASLLGVAGTGLSAVETDPAEYALRLKPVLFLRLDEAPVAGKGCFRDALGTSPATVGSPDRGLPTSIPGAAPWLGSAIAFAHGASSVNIPWTPAMASVGDTEASAGLSVAFWYKTKEYYANSRVLYLPGVLDVMQSKNAGGKVGYTLCGGQISIDKAEPGNPDKLMDGTWHHVGVSADFTKETENLSLFLDGQRVKTVTVVFSDAKPVKKAFLTLGTRSSNGIADFSGALDELALFDRPLRADEMAALQAGPVFAGLPQHVVLPGKAVLRASVPPKTQAQWRQKSGPAPVVLAHADRHDTDAAFARPGTYVLTVSAAGLEHDTSVTVEPAVPPQVNAGNHRRVHGPRRTRLEGVVSQRGMGSPRPFTVDDSERPSGSGAQPLNQHDTRAAGPPPVADDAARHDGSATTVRWSRIEGPGDVTFETPDRLSTQATFSADGRYRLRLSATSAGLTGQGDVCVLVNDSPSPRSTNALLSPLISLPMDEPAAVLGDALADGSGHTGLLIQNTSRGLPMLIPGARPFTGYAWDFSAVDARIELFNHSAVSHLGDTESDAGLSCTFWMKARFEGAAGKYLFRSGAMAITSLGKTGLQFSFGPAKLTTGSAACFDGAWHHVAATVDFRQRTDNGRVFVDGVAVETRSLTFEGPFHDIRQDHPLILAARGTPRDGELYHGALDEVAFYDRPLAENEIRLLVTGPNAAQAAVLARTELPRLVAGRNQAIPLPRTSTDLAATISAPGFTVHWSTVSGPGEVVFATPDALTTTVSFRHRASVPSGLYGAYVLRVTARDASGLELHDDLTVTLFEDDKPRVRTLSTPPPPGIHPRILFSPEDLPGLRERAHRVPHVKAALENVRSEAARLQDPRTPEGSLHQRLLRDDPTVTLDPYLKKVAVDASFYRIYFLAALVALVEDDQKAGSELGRVLCSAARRHLTIAQPGDDSDQYLGLAYDALAPWMEEPTRRPVRQLLSRLTSWHEAGSVPEPAQACSTNLRNYYDYPVIAALAIEGEEGYDPRVFQTNIGRLRKFFTLYGVHASGSGHEAFVYFNFGMQWAGPSMIATARRDENFFRTARVHDLLLFGFRQMSPWGDAIYSHDDGGWRDDVPFFSFPPFVAPWIFPESKPVRAMAQALIANAKGPSARLLNWYAVLFGTDLGPPIGAAEAAQSDHLPLTMFCPDSGFMLARSAWADDAIRLDFRCKPDLYALGHCHPDRNSFELFGAGREWIVDAGKARWYNDDHATILVDGVGGPLSVRKPSKGNWIPGRFVEYQESTLASIGCGDAKPFYDWVHAPIGDAAPVNDHGLLWADFVYRTPREQAIRNEPWRRAPIFPTLWPYNPMQRAFRTTALVRGTHPYVLVVDDYAKDERKHAWDWIANVPSDNLHQCLMSVVDRPGSPPTDLVIRHNADRDGGPRLLVRVLNAQGLCDRITLEDRTYTGEYRSFHSVISIKAQAVVPDYRVLLFPHRDGEELPTTAWNGDKTRLTVRWKDQEDTITLTPEGDGRNRVAVTRAGVRPVGPP